MSDVPDVTKILTDAAMAGYPITITQAFMLQEAIASCAIEGIKVPDAAGIGRLAKEISQRASTTTS